LLTLSILIYIGILMLSILIYISINSGRRMSRQELRMRVCWSRGERWRRRCRRVP
jgi:hypothetical protein